MEHTDRTVYVVVLCVKTVGAAPGSSWARQSGAICSILSLLLLGAALVAYGSGALMLGNKPLPAGMAGCCEHACKELACQLMQTGLGYMTTICSTCSGNFATGECDAFCLSAGR